MKLTTNYHIRLAGILLLTLLRFAFSSSDKLAGNQPATFKIVVIDLIISLLTAIVMWEANRALVIYYNRRSLLEKTAAGRFAKEALLVAALNACIYAGFIAIMMLLDPAARPHWVYLLFGMLDRIVYGLLVAGFYEMLLFVYALKTANEEAALLKKLNVTIQLESLKNQVKPHFLFNSLNTLTALVEKDQAKAVKFIAELSKVYRYLLQSNDKELIALQQELQFTEAYFFLLLMRFGEGAWMKTSIDEQAKQCLIPPLTLQMLVENAIKHNQVSVRKPLEVKIWSEDNKWLVVQNNLQPKRHASSTGVGLSNIATKLKLLNQPDLQIIDDGQFFTIKVPLIKAI